MFGPCSCSWYMYASWALRYTLHSQKMLLSRCRKGSGVSCHAGVCQAGVHESPRTCELCASQIGPLRVTEYTGFFCNSKSKNKFVTMKICSSDLNDPGLRVEFEFELYILPITLILVNLEYFMMFSECWQTWTHRGCRLYSLKRSDVSGNTFEWLLGENYDVTPHPPYFIVLDC